MQFFCDLAHFAQPLIHLEDTRRCYPEIGCHAGQKHKEQEAAEETRYESHKFRNHRMNHIDDEHTGSTPDQ